MFKLIKKSEASIRKIANNKTAINYITKEDLRTVSFALLEAKNYEENEITNYDRIYFVLKGTLKLKFNDEIISLNTEDCCVINKETKYKMIGTFKAIVINQPAFGT